MTRVKGGVRTRRIHKKVLRLAKGYRMSRNRLFKRAQEAVLHSGEHAFWGRRQRRRNVRRLWITRINAALIEHGLNYSSFIKGLKDQNISLNRKMLSEMAISDPKSFETIVKKVKASFK